MRSRLTLKLLCSFVLVTGLSAGADRKDLLDREGPDDESSYRRVSMADCNYAADPDAYLLRLRRHIEALSNVTERVVGRKVYYSRRSRRGRQRTFRQRHSCPQLYR